uniref:Erythromycin biosynthesis protein CIII-like C-terminal domain-containing protein n=1 Tax=Leersia perrieri TaxID=77586 RepID=A0A0D9WY29_9ORYZ
MATEFDLAMSAVRGAGAWYGGLCVQRARRSDRRTCGIRGEKCGDGEHDRERKAGDRHRAESIGGHRPAHGRGGRRPSKRRDVPCPSERRADVAGACRWTMRPVVDGGAVRSSRGGAAEAAECACGMWAWRAEVADGRGAVEPFEAGSKHKQRAHTTHTTVTNGPGCPDRVEMIRISLTAAAPRGADRTHHATTGSRPSARFALSGGRSRVSTTTRSVNYFNTKAKPNGRWTHAGRPLQPRIPTVVSSSFLHHASVPWSGRMKGASAAGGGGLEGEGFGASSDNSSLQNEGTSPRGMGNAECSESSSDRSNLESIKSEESALSSSIFDKKISIKKKIYGHRVRLATHANFKDFVVTAGLEFYPLASEIPIQRKEIKDIIFSLLPACKDPDTDTGAPFNADAIIANPAAYAVLVLLVQLGAIYTEIFSLMPTCEFPHPFSRVKQPAGYKLSYQIVDSFVWLGIRDIINDFRKRKLRLRPVTYLSNTHGYSNDIPHAYIWSPYLVPKPKDWGPKIDVVGFCFLDLASNFNPPEPLLKWLESGEKPIYIGFGSLPIPEPDKLTRIIVEALEITGQRGIINKGWGGLGNLEEPKESVYIIDNIPHDWLFLQCKAVVHHGGAGTTAASLKAACPTTIIPFFGDQFFWGNMVHARGLGAPPVPVEQLQLHQLVGAIKFMMDPKVKERAVELAKAIESEDGVDGAVKAFLKHLPQPRSPEKPQPAPPSTFMQPLLLPVKRCFGIAS